MNIECPTCGSNDVSWWDAYVGETEAVLDFSCRACGHEWVDPHVPMSRLLSETDES